MKKGYLQCKLSFTPQCPQLTNPVMGNLRAKKDVHVDLITKNGMNAANEMYQKCDDFEPKSS